MPDLNVAQEIAAALDSVVAAGGLEAAVAQQQQSEMGGPPVRLQASAVLVSSQHVVCNV